MTKYFSEILNSISEIVKYDSTEQPALENMPFGKGCADSLDYFLSLASSLGFEVHNYDNYVGEVIFGEGEEFAVLAHLDVVPVGSGWEHDPFGGEIDLANRKIWGRGTMDDKGPAIATLYCLKALKDEGITPKRKIKLIVGCNEESGWKCIKHYNKVAKMPDEGFSPDAEYPVIYAEKGIMPIRFTYPVQNPAFTHLQGGTVVNAVCDYCEAIAPVTDEAASYGLTVEDGKLISRGVAAHASTPHRGKNAILPMLSYLGLNELIDALFNDKFGITKLCDESGHLTFSPDIISFDGNAVTVDCDIRYPATLCSNQVTAVLDTFGIEYQVLENKKPLFCDKNSPLIRTMLSVYNEITGEQAEPIAIGGGTYARALKHGCGFGPETADVDNRIHNSNEFITFDQIELMCRIYTETLRRICF